MTNSGRSSFINRRDFVKTAAAGSVAFSGFPSIVPSFVLGKNAPSNQINIGQIGCGRIAQTHDLPETFKNKNVRIVGVSDVDRSRQQGCKRLVEGWYAKRDGGSRSVDAFCFLRCIMGWTIR